MISTSCRTRSLPWRPEIAPGHAKPCKVMTWVDDIIGRHTPGTGAYEPSNPSEGHLLVEGLVAEGVTLGY
ncbi:hypothetical protein GCM10010404_83330 [Nonomuraea africana]